MSLAYQPTTLGAGIDYITCTAARPASVGALLALGEDLLRQEEGCGGVRKPWHWQGFSGHQAGGAATGFTGRRACVRASGATARECATDAINCADNVSRLDVQVTVSSSVIGSEYAESLYSSLSGVIRRRGRPIERTLIQNSSGGSSLYLGRRISDSYGRIYNKSVEEGIIETPPRWRYEVEFKRKLALASARAYASASDRDSWCVAEVYDWFDKRGCSPPINKVDRVDTSGDARGSSAQARRLEWLKVGVRPVVVKLAAEYGWPDVLALLGVPMMYSDRYVNEVLGSGE